MSKAKFDRLMENIKVEGHLESLPLCSFKGDGREELEIISGHHRIRACRVANILEVFVLVYEKPLTSDQVKAKQLAHNSLNGFDDNQLLKEIYDSIDSLSAKLESGITEEDLEIGANIKVDEVGVDFDFQNIHLLFMDSQKEAFDDVMKVLEEKSSAYASELKHFEKFKLMAQQISGEENVRNIGGIILKMCEVVNEYYNLPQKGEFNRRISLKVPDEVYEAWQEWRKKTKKIMGYNNDSKAFEFAIQEALNIPEESLQ
jgi:hypothetical protein